MLMVFYIFASILLVSLVSLVGIFFLFMKENSLKELNFVLIGLSVGALLGGAFFHIIPEVYSKHTSATTSFAILFGIFAFFFLEKILHWHHSHSLHPIENNECKSCGEKLPSKTSPIGPMIIVSDGLHNMLDGVLIASSFILSTEAGIATTIAVLLHEIPQEIGDFGVLLHSGYSKAKAMFLNFLSALTAFLGAILVFAANEFLDKYMFIFTAFAAGSLLYIAMADLIPELHKKNKATDVFGQFAMIILGMGLMYSLTLIE